MLDRMEVDQAHETGARLGAWVSNSPWMGATEIYECMGSLHRVGSQKRMNMYECKINDASLPLRTVKPSEGNVFECA